MEYPINRYAMETKRQLDVLDQHLANHTFMIKDDYTIADMAIYPWYGRLCLGELYVSDSYDAAKFLEVHTYQNVIRWAKPLQLVKQYNTPNLLSLKQFDDQVILIICLQLLSQMIPKFYWII